MFKPNIYDIGTVVTNVGFYGEVTKVNLSNLSLFVSNTQNCLQPK